MDDLNRKSSLSSGTIFRFGLFALDVSAGLLTRNGLRIKLQDQPFQLLALLLEKNGQIVTREEIRLRLWESNTFVDFDKSLGVAIVKVRESLGDSAANPRFLETVPRRGYRFIAPVTVNSPQSTVAAPPPIANPASASPAIASPAAVAAKPPADPPGNVDAELSAASRRSASPWRSRPVLAVVLACVAFTIAFAFYHSRRQQPSHVEASPPAAASQINVRRSVAVLGFRNLSGEQDQSWLSGAFTEMLNTELAAKGDLRLVSGEDVANVKHDLALPAEDTLAKATLSKLRSSLGADVVVVGSYTLLNDGGKNRIRLDIRAQDTALGETVFEDAISGNENDLFDLGSEAGSRIRESLNPSLSLAPATDTPLSPGSSDQLAEQFYSEGRARLYEFDFVGARDLLKRAVAADPNFALAHSALSNAFSSLGYETPARDEAKEALKHTHGLPQETVLSIQGQYDETVSDWQGAVDTYGKLFQLFPDNLSYGLRLAKVQLPVNPTAVAHTLALLRALPAPQGEDPRIDLMEASALIGQDLPKARQAAQRAIAKASARRATLMVARGYGILCQQDMAISAPIDQSSLECNQARNSYLSAGDQNNAARTLNDLAGIYFQHGDLAKAQSMWEQAIEVFRQVGDTQGQAASENNVGDVLLQTGKLDEAQRLLRQAIAGYKLIGDHTGVALAKVDLGEIALQNGDVAAARADDQEAIAIGSQIGDKSASAYGMTGLGDVLLQHQELAAARMQYEKALALRKELGERESILQSRVALARLAIEEGHAADAEAQIRDCVDELHAQQLGDDELNARLVLLSALLQQGKSADAMKEAIARRPLYEQNQSAQLQMRFRLELARAMLLEHDLKGSRDLLEKVSSQAEPSGFTGLAWEARMVLAQAQREDGDASGAAKQLKLLAAQERKQGLLLLARKADGDGDLEGTPKK